MQVRLALSMLVVMALGALAMATAATVPPPVGARASLSVAQPSAQCERATADLVKLRADLKTATEAAGGLQLNQRGVQELLNEIERLGDLVPIDQDGINRANGDLAEIRSVLDLRAQVDAAVTKRDRLCAVVPPSASTPPPTSTPPPPPADLDCSDFPLADGRTAQQVFDADRGDTFNLDLDGDQVACELNEQIDGESDGNLDSGDIPDGGIETGRGDAMYSPAENVAIIAVTVAALAAALTIGLRTFRDGA